jgi:hypothetical protein
MEGGEKQHGAHMHTRKGALYDIPLAWKKKDAKI